MLLPPPAAAAAEEEEEEERSSALDGRLLPPGAGVLLLLSCLTATSERSKSRENLRAQVKSPATWASRGACYLWRGQGSLAAPADHGRKNCRTCGRHELRGMRGRGGVTISSRRFNWSQRCSKILSVGGIANVLP
jgi:hypothetical protein